MKLLLDECVPEDLKDFISGHEVASTAEMGWRGIKNGELMRLAADAGFEAFLTADKNIRHQQNISKYQIAVIVFDVYRNTVDEFRKKLPEMYETLPTVEKGKLFII
jgi:hypothetical protein